MLKPVKIIFAGTPDFSAPYLEGLLADPDFAVAGVITQPDKPSGRQQALSPSPVKILAEKSGLKIWQPEKLNAGGTLAAELAEAGADLLIVVAYGQIIPRSILDAFPRGAINVHPSLLPKYRGASPIQSAILNGDKETGISIMLMDEKMDHGPILDQQKVPLTGEETNASLHFKLAQLGAPLLFGTIKSYLEGKLTPQPQDDSAATYCSAIGKEEARIDWRDPAQKIKQKIYAFHPWPAAWTTLDGKRLKIFPPAAVKSGAAAAGKIEATEAGLAVGCGRDVLILKKIQLEGKNESGAEDFARGHKDIDGKILS